MHMKNVTIRNESGERVAFYRNFPVNEAQQIATLRQDIGHGVYNVCYQKTATKLDGEGRATKRTFPVRKKVFVDGGETKSGASVILSGSGPQHARQGMASDHQVLLQNLIEAIQTLDQNVAEMRDELSDIRGELFDEENDETVNEPEEKSGMVEKLSAVMLNPAYSGLISGLMAPNATPEQMAETVGTEMNKNPGILRDLIAEVLK